MRLSEWRGNLQTYIESIMTIDSWNLDFPEFPGEVVGNIPPIRNYELMQRESESWESTYVQDFFVLVSYPTSILYDQLPWEGIYGLYQTVALNIVTNFNSIHPDITQMLWLNTSIPFRVIEEVSTREDWLLELLWTFRPVVTAEPELISGLPGTIIDTFEVTSVRQAIWKNELGKDFTVDSLLDYTFNSDQI